MMSQFKAGGVELCDNQPNPDVLTGQTRNLNEANTLSQAASQSGDGEGRGLIPACLNNNGKNEEKQERDEYRDEGRAKDEEEDVDAVMRDEDDESEGSSCLVHCLSPDTPMTDSSYSETGTGHTSFLVQFWLERLSRTNFYIYLYLYR